MTIDALQDKLGYRFGSEPLLRQALTHRSHGQSHNERLEFLGDSVLNCVVAALLYDTFVKVDEGDLSRVRSNLVKQQTLYEIAQRIELSQHLLLGEGELKSGGFRRPSILGDTMEAVIGAIFVDGGFDAAYRVVRTLYEPILKSVDPKTLGKDAKTLLQEYLQGRKVPLPVYSVVATHGAAHNQLFEVECAIPKLAIQVLGSGGSRRAAEQAAAKLALEKAQSLLPASSRKPRATRAGKPPAPAATKPAEPKAADSGNNDSGPADANGADGRAADANRTAVEANGSAADGAGAGSADASSGAAPGTAATNESAGAAQRVRVKAA
ncbi:MAG TPA: ribonuclease III [Burkholderiaceae bacterium]|nr:ribonuclease III [Burkholderiaceae bacterium]